MTVVRYLKIQYKVPRDRLRKFTRFDHGLRNLCLRVKLMGLCSPVVSVFHDWLPSANKSRIK